MGLLNPHLEDDDFADVWSARTAVGAPESDRPAESHLRKCAECQGRYTSFVSWLDGIRADAPDRDRRSLQPRPPRRAAAPDLPEARVPRASGARHRVPEIRPPGGHSDLRPPPVDGGGRGDRPHHRHRPRPAARVPHGAVPRPTRSASASPARRFRRPSRPGTSSRYRSTTTRRSSSRKSCLHRSGSPNPCSTLNAITPGARDLDPR